MTHLSSPPLPLLLHVLSVSKYSEHSRDAAVVEEENSQQSPPKGEGSTANENEGDDKDDDEMAENEEPEMQEDSKPTEEAPETKVFAISRTKLNNQLNKLNNNELVERCQQTKSNARQEHAAKKEKIISRNGPWCEHSRSHERRNYFDSRQN